MIPRCIDVNDRHLESKFPASPSRKILLFTFFSANVYKCKQMYEVLQLATNGYCTFAIFSKN